MLAVETRNNTNERDKHRKCEVVSSLLDSVNDG